MHRGAMAGMAAGGAAVAGGVGALLGLGPLGGATAVVAGLLTALAASFVASDVRRTEQEAVLDAAQRAHDERSAGEARAALAASEARARHAEEQARLALEHPGTTSLLDPDTGLPDRRFFTLNLESRIAGARRHLWPVSVLLISLAPEVIDEGDGPAPASALPEAAGLERLLASVDDPFLAAARIVRETVRDADATCRLGDRVLGLLLEDTPDQGAVWVAERIQIALGRIGHDLRTVAVGIASYPTHGLTADAVALAARAALAGAKATAPSAGFGPIKVADPAS